MREYKQPTLPGAITTAFLEELTSTVTVVGDTVMAVLRMVSWTVAGGLVGGTGGLLFGTLFGALYGLIRLEPWRVVYGAGYFALCGAAAGAIVGAFYRIFDGPHAYPWDDWSNEDSREPSWRDVDPFVRERWIVTKPAMLDQRCPQGAEVFDESHEKKLAIH